MPAPAAEKEFVYKSTVMKEYGLTPKMVDELGSPDFYCENPHYRCAPEASCYAISRIEAWVAENKDRVEAAKLSRIKRSAAARAAHERKRAEEERQWQEGFEKARAWLDTVEITIVPLPDSLLWDAQQCVTFGKHYKDYVELKALRSYVRRNLTNYLDVSHQLGRIGYYVALDRQWQERVDGVVVKALLDWKAAHPDAAVPELPPLNQRRRKRRRRRSSRWGLSTAAPAANAPVAASAGVATATPEAA
jgi:hypothetical protein